MQAEAELVVSLARWAGQHAWALFLGLTALWLAASLVGGWLFQRYAVLVRQGHISPGVFRGLHIAAGGTVMVLGAAVFAEVAGELGATNPLGQADQAFTDALSASVPRAALHLFAAVTHLGDTATLTGLGAVVAVALVLAGRRWLALGWVAALAGNGLLNQTLKQIFGRVRPLRADDLVLEPGFSFPSGHSSGSVVAYGMLAYLAFRLLPPRWHLPALLAALTLAFTVGASRVFLRVHFVSDVLAGFASGLAWLALCVTSIELIRWRQLRGAA